MAGQLSDAQPMWVRFPQLRSCFSGAMEAQLFRNQQAVGSNPTGSSQILKYVPVSRRGYCGCGRTAMQRLVMPPYAGSNPVSHLDDSRSGVQVPLLSLILE